MTDSVNRCLVLLGAVLWSACIAAEQPAKRIVVTLDGCPGESLNNVSIVLDGRDLDSVPLKPVPDEGNHWAAGGHWFTERLDRIDAANAKASLRLHPGRTACRRATPAQYRPGEWIAQFRFRCPSPRDARTIELRAMSRSGSPLELAYQRDVHPVEQGVRCSEGDVFELGEGTIGNVDVKREEVRIFPGSGSACCEFPGILLNDLAARPVERLLSAKDLGALFQKQTATEPADAAPTSSGNWSAKVKAQLENRDVKSVSVKVKR